MELVSRNLSIWPAVIFSIVLLAATMVAQVNDESLVRAKGFVMSNENLLESNLSSAERFYLLTRLVPAALAAGDQAKAEKYAKDLQTTENNLRPGTFRGSSSSYATHISNTVLGLIAIDKGNVEEAGDLLLRSGDLSGRIYPTLSSFGPNMLLAQKLLERGEREIVIRYLDSCSKFWKMEDGRIARWKSIIQAGGKPDFGPSLRYGMNNWRY